jgi:hypothetical protein
VNNVSYNGGTGGVQAQPTAQEQAWSHEPHTAPLAAQTQQETAAGQNRQNFASVNQGRPAIAATARPGDFSSRSAIPARSAGGEYHAPAMSPREARGPSTPMNANSSQGFRSFTPPNSNAQNKTTTTTPATSPAQNQPKANTARPAPPQPKKSSPPPPQHQNPPKEHHNNKF